MCLTFGRMGRLNTPGKQLFATSSRRWRRFLSYGLAQLALFASMNPTADFTEVPTATVPCAGGCQVQDRGRMIQVPCAGLEKEHPDIEEITGNFTGETCGTGGCFIVSSELVRTYSVGRSGQTRNVYRYEFSKYETTAVIDGGEVIRRHGSPRPQRVARRRAPPLLAARGRRGALRRVLVGDDNPECLTLADPASVAGHLVGGLVVYFAVGAVQLVFGLRAWSPGSA